MRYAPLGAGVDPELVPIEPRLGAIGGRAEVWTPAARAARAFWTGVAREESVAVSAAMRELAGVNLRVVEAFVAPLAR
jgi:hypothetical protein